MLVCILFNHNLRLPQSILEQENVETRGLTTFKFPTCNPGLLLGPANISSRAKRPSIWPLRKRIPHIVKPWKEMGMFWMIPFFFGVEGPSVIKEPFLYIQYSKILHWIRSYRTSSNHWSFRGHKTLSGHRTFRGHKTFGSVCYLSSFPILKVVHDYGGSVTSLGKGQIPAIPAHANRSDVALFVHQRNQSLFLVLQIHSVEIRDFSS